MSLPRISVVTITYGHELYIIDCIRGVLSQQYDGEIEFIIANDSSPDQTDKIIKEFFKSVTVQKNIEIRYVRHEVNKGMMANSIWAIEQCTGEYIALCEGDDYWTDALKLQKQVVFLEENKDYVICFHSVMILKRNGRLVEDFITKIPNKFELRETLLQEGNYIHTPSVVFRNCLVDLPLLMNYSPIGDMVLYVLLTRYGKIGYIDKKMAVYRHEVGIISNYGNRLFINELKMNLIVLKLVNNDKDSIIIINRIIKIITLNIYNLPFEILKMNIFKLPKRLLNRYF